MIEALYIHIPFCKRICIYCDFHKELATEKKQKDYIYALCRELLLKKDTFSNVKTIFIGGGTPSSISFALLKELLQTIDDVVNMDQVDEFTIECNPEDITKKRASLLKSYHVNRISMGVQTFDEEQLKYLRRSHTNQVVYDAIDTLHQVGIHNISIDLMFSLPHQTLDDVKHDIKKALQLDITHISYYNLIIEEQSILYHKLDDNPFIQDDDLEATMYETIIDTLSRNGFHQYEISNFTKKDYESIHNKTYWNNEEYIGIGSGAHSYVNQTRFYHEPNVQQYIKGAKTDTFFTKQEETDVIGDTLLLGLRLTKGISLEKLNQLMKQNVFNKYPKLKEFERQELIEQTDGYLRLTRRGLLYGNLVFRLFVEE